MFVRKTLPAILGVASLFAAPALFASPLHLVAPVHAALGKTKTVKFDIRNGSTMPTHPHFSGQRSCTLLRPKVQ